MHTFRPVVPAVLGAALCAGLLFGVPVAALADAPDAESAAPQAVEESASDEQNRQLLLDDESPLDESIEVDDSLSAFSEGGHTGSGALIDISSATVTASAKIYTGSELTPSVSVVLGDELLASSNYSVSFSNNVNVGTATVTVTGVGEYTGTASGTFSIKAKSIAGATISPIDEQVYDGSEKTPAITVKDGSQTLAEGTDYSLSFSNNTNAGTATVTIAGKGNYNGTKTATFTIACADLSSAVVTASDQVYTGKELEPTPVVTLDSKMLSNSDYVVSYQDNIEMGTATITVAGKGNYSGTATGAFSIREMAGTWVKVGSRWQYHWSDGTYAASELLTIDGKTYWFDSSGNMATGWVEDSGAWRYFSSSGAMATGWLQLGKTWYWFDDTGIMATGRLVIGGATYVFTSSGAMATGWKQVGSDWYYLKASGAAAKGWMKQGTIWYWFNSQGVMATGLRSVDGKTYYFKSSGAMATGWVKTGSSWRWFGPSGVMATGWRQISGVWYWFSSQGVMATGWLEISGSRYYFKSSGAMVTNWQKIGGKWYYFSSSGTMAKSKWIQKWYYVGADGAMMESGITPDGYRIVNGKWDGKGKVA